MALSVKKMMNDEKVVKLYDSLLEKYLLNFDITQDTFNPNVIRSDIDKVVLERYYDSALENARRLVIEDELVGITFDNLDVMVKVLKQTN